jgi:hypothetical protein
VNVGVWIIDVKKLVLVDFGDNDYANNDAILKCKLILKPMRCRTQGMH